MKFLAKVSVGVIVGVLILMWMFSHRLLPEKQIEIVVRKSNSFYHAEYQEIWRNVSSAKRPFGGINKLPPLIFITPENAMGYEFFKYIFEDVGLAVTDDENSNWTMCYGDRHFPNPRFIDQRMNRINLFYPVCSKLGMCNSIWRSYSTAFPDTLIEEIGKVTFSPPCFLVPGNWTKVVRYSELRGIPLKTAADSQITKLESLSNRRLPTPPSWILKADKVFGGSGIFILKTLGELVSGRSECLDMEASPEKVHSCAIPTGVIQSFAQDVLLVHGKRINIRTFVLVDSLNPLRVFASRVGLLTIGSVRQDESMTTPVHPMCPWIINPIYQGAYCNRTEDLPGDDLGDYIKNGLDLPLNDRTGSSFWSTEGLADYLREYRPDLSWEKMWQSAMTSIGRSILHGYLYAPERSRYLPRTDQMLMGADLLVFDNGDVSVAEINCHPGMSNHGHLIHKVKHVVIEDSVRMTGMTQYSYPPEDELAAAEATDIYCDTLPTGCSDTLRITIRDTELMMQNSRSFDLVHPNPKLFAEDYERFLPESQFENDRKLSNYISFRDGYEL